MNWWDRAACKGKPLHLFFAQRGQNVEKAKRICECCPVKQECLQDAVKHEFPYQRHGIYGGLSAREREIKYDGRKPAPPKPPQTHCKKGHALTPDNVVSFGRDRRKCKKCHRDAMRKTHCRKGHELTQDNVRIWGGTRRCKTCVNEASRAWKEKNVPRRSKTRCRNGHEYTPENTYMARDGRRCLTCQRAQKRDWMRKKRAAQKNEQGTHRNNELQQVG